MLSALLSKFAQRLKARLKRRKEQSENCPSGKSILVKSEIKLSSNQEVEKED